MITAIAAIFTLGAWINRRHDRCGVNDPIRTPLLHEDDIEQEQDTHGVGADTVTEASGRKRLSLQSRALARYPFLLEIWYWLLIYWVRNYSRPMIISSI